MFLAQWEMLYHIFLHFGVAYGLITNGNKSILIYSYGKIIEIQNIAATFGVDFKPIQDEFTYFGYRLKLKNYHVQDWSWMLQKFRKKLKCWTHQTLSLGGRFTLIQSVLQNMAVY